MKSKSFMTLPAELTDTLRDSELLLVVGGLGGSDSANNASGTCVGANNKDGVCTGANNANGRCNTVNNGNGICGTVINNVNNCDATVKPRPDNPKVP